MWALPVYIVNEKSSDHFGGCPQWGWDPGILERCGSTKVNKLVMEHNKFFNLHK